MKNSIYKNVISVKLNNFEAKDLDKVKISKNLRELNKDSDTSKKIKELITFQKIFNHQETPYYTIQNRFKLFRIRIDKKDIPSSVLNEELEIKCQEYIDREGVKPKGKLLKELKEDIVSLLLPKAFIKSSFIDFCIDTEKNLLIANISSASKLEVIMTKLREFLDINYETESELDLSAIMTEWLKEEEAKEPFEMEDFVSLQDLGTGGISEHKKEPLHDSMEEVKASIAQNKIVKSMRLNWHERISFTLTDEFILKSIKAMDVFNEYVDEELGESYDEYSYFESSMFIFISDIIEILEDLRK